MIQVYEDSERFVLRDKLGHQYGLYRNREEATARCLDWNDYYAAPLLMAPSRESGIHGSRSPEESLEILDDAVEGFTDKMPFSDPNGINDLEDPKMSVNLQNGDFPTSTSPSTSDDAVASEIGITQESVLFNARGGRPRKWASEAERKAFARAAKRAQIEDEIRRLTGTCKRLGNAPTPPRLDSGIVPAIKGSFKIRKPAWKSELEVHAELWTCLKSDGYTVHADVAAPAAAESATASSVTNRLDLVIFNDTSAVGVIEVKRGSGSWSKRQKEKYAIYGVPQLLYNEHVSYEQVKKFVDDCLKFD